MVELRIWQQMPVRSILKFVENAAGGLYEKTVSGPEGEVPW
jgi:hypothetical protein